MSSDEESRDDQQYEGLYRYHSRAYQNVRLDHDADEYGSDDNDSQNEAKVLKRKVTKSRQRSRGGFVEVYVTDS